MRVRSYLTKEADVSKRMFIGRRGALSKHLNLSLKCIHRGRFSRTVGSHLDVTTVNCRERERVKGTAVLHSD